MHVGSQNGFGGTCPRRGSFHYASGQGDLWGLVAVSITDLCKPPRPGRERERPSSYSSQPVKQMGIWTGPRGSAACGTLKSIQQGCCGLFFFKAQGTDCLELNVPLQYVNRGKWDWTHPHSSNFLLGRCLTQGHYTKHALKWDVNMAHGSPRTSLQLKLKRQKEHRGEGDPTTDQQSHLVLKWDSMPVWGRGEDILLSPGPGLPVGLQPRSLNRKELQPSK